MEQIATLDSQVLRNLGDRFEIWSCFFALSTDFLVFVCFDAWNRSYEKRKAAALEIEHLIKELNDGHKTVAIEQVIMMLKKDFIESSQANQRKGGLIGLAASAIGLMKVHTSLLLLILSSSIVSSFLCLRLLSGLRPLSPSSSSSCAGAAAGSGQRKRKTEPIATT